MKIDYLISNFKDHGKEFFEGVSQALFFKNSYFGFLLVFIALIFNWQVFACGVFASFISYIYSTLYRTPKILKQTGLMTINGFFFGIAFSSLFQVSATFYFCLIIGAFAIPLVTKASFEVLQHWKLSPLIFPYILAIWIFWLCSNVISLSHETKILTVSNSFLLSPFTELPLGVKLINSVLLSMGEIFFFRNADFGLCLLILISLFSPRRGFYFLMGTALATIVYYGVSLGQSAWHYGFFSYSAGLVGIGLAARPEKFNWRTIIIFCILSLFVTLALEQLLAGLNLPVLSLPYVFTFWFALLSRAPRLNVDWAPTEVLLR